MPDARTVPDSSTNPSQDAPLPPAFTIGQAGSFEWGVFHQRHPALVAQLCETLPVSPEQIAALHALVEESRHGDVREPAEHDPARRAWLAWGEPYFGRPWRDLPFLWAESYFDRRLLDAFGFFTEGPWRGVDPFAPLKAAELRDPALVSGLAWLDDAAGAPPHEAFEMMLLGALYGNRADLSFKFDSNGEPLPEGSNHQLVHDDSALVWSHLTANAPGQVAIVLDNAGRELIADLLLADHLLSRGLAETVVLHVKPVPYYVSDTTTADLRDCLAHLAAMPTTPGQAGRRLHRAATEGRLRIDTHAFYCAPFSYHHMPDDLTEKLAGARLTIYKGDLNYRRLVGDCDWDPTVPFASTTAYLPGPTVTLRTLKSNVVVGLDAATTKRLDEADPTWRVNGTRALIQARIP